MCKSIAAFTRKVVLWGTVSLDCLSLTSMLQAFVPLLCISLNTARQGTENSKRERLEQQTAAHSGW